MTQWKVRELGTTGPYAPNLKRAHGILSNGRDVVGFMDTNLSNANGDDKTGVSKFYVYAYNRSTDNGNWTQSIAYNLVQPAVSSTKQFIGAFTVGPGDRLYLAYVANNNSLRLVTWAGYNGAYGWSAPTEQEILPSSAITNKIRAVDITVSTTGSVAIPVVATYEAAAANGKGAYCRVYGRRTNETTWDKIYERLIVATTLTIKAGGEDVSISFDKGNIVSNVAKLALYFTQTATTADSGDRVDELTWNVSTGGSATVVGSWFGSTNNNRLNRDMASGQRRGWLYSDVAGRWMLATAVGRSAPFFEGIKLRHNVFSGMVRNRIGYITVQGAAGRPATSTAWWIDRRLVSYADANQWGYISTSYADNRLVFAWNGMGANRVRAVRAAVMQWPNPTTDTASYMDQTARFWDGGYGGPDTGVNNVGPSVIGIYGGNNFNNNVGRNNYAFAIVYGDPSSAVSATEDIRERHLCIVAEDMFTAPKIISPTGFITVPSGRPQLQMSFKPSQQYLNVRGRPVWELSMDPDFLTDVRVLKDPTTPFISFDADNVQQIPNRVFTYAMKSSDLRLQSGWWYIRGYLEDDFGFKGAVSVGGESEDTFQVSHPPIALPLSPSTGKTLLYGSGSVSFNWRFTDPEVGDSQSAYQLVVEDVETGAVVYDSGKVVSSSKTSSATIAPELKDFALQWRVRLWDQDDTVGVYSDPQLFTVADPPTATITSPTQGEVVTTALPTFVWAFTAGGDRQQRAYRLTVYDDTTSPPTPVAETGWVSSSANNHAFPAKILENNKTYSVVIQVQDDAGLYSEVNREVDFENVVTNSNFEVDTNGWDAANGATIARSTARSHRGAASLLVTAGGAGSPHADSNVFSIAPGQTVHAWGWMNAPTGGTNVGIKVNWLDADGIYMSTAGGGVTLDPDTWTFREVSVVAPAGAAFASINVGTSDTPAAGYEMYFDEVQANQTGPGITTFDTDWVEPVAVIPTLTSDPFKVIVSWDSTLKDPDFVSWRVYRRYMKPYQSEFDLDDTASTWVLVYETMDDSPTLSFWDYTTPFHKPIDYVVVQLVDRFGSLLESDITGWATITQRGDRYYFIPAVPVGAIASFEAGSVNADSFNAEVEQETLHVIGRGRQVQVGDDLGYNGSLTIKLRNPDTARRDREFLELLASPRTGNVYLKSPFGDILYVRLGPISTTRQAGFGGGADIADITVPYQEVFDDEPPITRVV